MISDWLKRGSGQLLAVMPEPDVDRLAETIVAFANADGGTIVLGIDESGRSTGAVYPEEIEAMLQDALRQCRPLLEVECQQEEIAGGFVFYVRVPRSTELHSLADGRVLIRRKGENHPLSGEEIRHLAATKSTGDYEVQVVPGATRDDLDEEVIQEFLQRWQEKQRRPWTRSVDDLLVQIGALTEEGQPTVAGLLLFGQDPQAFLPKSGLVFVKFLGMEPRGERGEAGYGRREDVGGPLARIIQRSWTIIMEEMRTGAVVKGLERIEQTEYPPAAVREALVNAVAHRDYRLRGRPIEVRMFTDRMEIISPGGLPGYITLDNIVEEHFSRNPRIVGALYYWGYIEELGLGIDLMIEQMTAAGLPPPEFRAEPYLFSVTLYNRRERPPIAQWQRTMNERQMKALEYIGRYGRITNREYQAICPHVSPETLRLDLADLVEKGVLIKVGDKKGTYYILR
ncbi:MAG: ATP-binding protein [Anaerolineae bacterium]|nr:putative DNA binding domain-containing protein [Anaerolineae bacterium]MDW8068629.1 ATP-binding protein [Anaerolineae bacterium]